MKSKQAKKRRILFFGEGATLAHVVRPLELACCLDQAEYQVFYACDPRYGHLVTGRNVNYVPIHSISSEAFLQRVYKACPLYTIAELRDYIQEDLKMITDVRPDIVVGDFRISLGISAELCGIPYVSLSNAHWSPSGNLNCPVPEHPLVRLFGVRLMRLLLRVTLPLFFNVQAKAFNRLRRSYGLPPVTGRGAHEVFTRGSRSLYLDIPELYDLEELSEREGYIGPVNWKPDIPLPEWWNRVPDDRPVIFVTPGSSGDVEATGRLIRTLASMDVTVLLATAGRLGRSQIPECIYTADFIPGLEAAARANLVICNGGSGMVYQALSMGTPVLGIPRNIDQHYVMEALQLKGAGKLIRSGAVTEDNIRSAVQEMLDDTSYQKSARRLQFHLSTINPADQLAGVVEELLEERKRFGEPDSPEAEPLHRLKSRTPAHAMAG